MLKVMLQIMLILGLLAISAALAYTQIKARQYEAAFPPIGEMIDVGGYKLHAVHTKPAIQSSKSALVFIHGASGNLRDMTNLFLDEFKDTHELLFIDRPGHGWSERGPETNNKPDGQADAIAKAMEYYDIDKAVIIGHSFGGAITASFALEHAEKTKGLLFLAPATHPWPGGIAWHYHITTLPVIGPIFTHLIAIPAGSFILEKNVANVFTPNDMPDKYIENTGPQLVLRPSVFQNNAKDVKNLYQYVEDNWPRYKSIKAPTIIISGKDDPVVYTYIHSRGLENDIEGAKLFELDNVGHHPAHAANDLTISAIQYLGGDTSIQLK